MGLIIKWLSYIVLIIALITSLEVGWRAYLEYQKQQIQEISLIIGHRGMDAYATIVMFIFSICFNNVSFFDAYWSLMPGYRLTRYMLAFYWPEFKGQIRLKYFLFHILVCLWSIRLFIYIFRRWKGFPHQDERINYMEKTLRNKSKYFGGIIYWICGGIFIALVNGVVLSLLTQEFNNFVLSAQENEDKITCFQACGLLLMFFGIFFEAQADFEMYNFQNQQNKPQICDEGLRRYCRFPQFFGEALFWWGVWLATQPTYGNLNYPIGVGLLTIWLLWQSKILNTRMQVRKQYQEYSKHVVSWWIPFFRF